MNINAIDNLGNTPLIQACIESNYDVAKILVNKGAKIDVVNKIGLTALMYSCERTNFNIVKLLIDNGADVNICNFDEENALMSMFYSYEYNNCDEHDINQHIKITKYFLENGLNSYNKNKSLAYACHVKSTESAKYLIDNGADVNYVEPEGYWTPLKHAIVTENYPLVEYLKNNGACLINDYEGIIICKNIATLNNILSNPAMCGKAMMSMKSPFFYKKN